MRDPYAEKELINFISKHVDTSTAGFHSNPAVVVGAHGVMLNRPSNLLCLYWPVQLTCDRAFNVAVPLCA